MLIEQDVIGRLFAELDSTYLENDFSEETTKVQVNYSDLLMLMHHYNKFKLVRPGECSCKGWGCRKCCATDAEVRSRQGVFG